MQVIKKYNGDFNFTVDNNTLVTDIILLNAPKNER